MCWLLLLCGQLADSDYFSPTLQDAALQATVQIVSIKGNDRYTGTGTVVGMQGSDAIILTAEHVIPPRDSCRVTFWPHDGQAPCSTALQVLHQSAAADLALVRVSAPPRTPGVLRICPPGLSLRPSFPVLTVGCSRGDPPTCETATVVDTARVRRAAATGQCWVTDREPAKGRSGGLMMNANGYLVGVCSSGNVGRGHYGSINEIHALCDAANLASLYKFDDAGKTPIAATAVTIKAKLALQRPVSWIDPSAWEAEAQLLLTLEVTSEVSPFLAPVPFVVRASDGIRCIEGFESFEVHGAEKIEIPLTIGLVAQRETPVTLTIEPLSKPDHVTLERAKVTVSMNVAPPPRVITTVRAIALRVGRAEWLDLTTGTASFEAQIQVKVDGPLGQFSKLALTAPAGVRRLNLSNDVIRTGEQSLTMNIVASVLPAPQRTRLRFDLQALAHGAIDVKVAEALDVMVTGPPAGRLALAQGNVPRPTFAAQLPADGSPALLRVNPVLLGVPSGASASNLDARLMVGTPMHLDCPVRAAILAPTVLRIAADRQPGSLSFFRDTLIEGKLTVTPAMPCPAVVGSEHTLMLRHDAPFKRVLCIVAAVAFLLIFVYVPSRFLWRLSDAPCDSSLTLDEQTHEP